MKIEAKNLEFRTKIEMPAHMPIMFFGKNDEASLERLFSDLKKRDSKNVEEYEACYALIQFAYSCWGVLSAVEIHGEKARFIFTFQDLEALVLFETEKQKAIDAASK